MSLPLSDIRTPNADTLRWLELHGQREGEYMTFDCRCTKLDSDGQCSIYSDRPALCRDFEPGCDSCLESVRARRTPVQAAQIREKGDRWTCDVAGHDWADVTTIDAERYGYVCVWCNATRTGELVAIHA